MSHPAEDILVAAPRPTPFFNARRLAAGIASTLRMARALATAGRSIDLTGLDGIVGVLCAQILDIAPGLAPALAQTMRSRLIEIAAQLDTLQGLMERDAAP